MKKKFLRLNSLESMESTSSNTSTNSSLSMNKLDLESVDAKMPPSGKESKWFGHYQNDYQYQHQPQQWHQEHSQHNQYFGKCILVMISKFTFNKPPSNKKQTTEPSIYLDMDLFLY